MTVEAVAYIRSVGNIFNDSVFFTELLNLKTAKTLCRCYVDRIEISILFYVSENGFINMFQNLQGKLTVLTNGLSVV